MKYSETCRKYIGQNKNFEKSSTNFDGFQESKASIKACWQKNFGEEGQEIVTNTLEEVS